MRLLKALTFARWFTNPGYLKFMILLIPKTIPSKCLLAFQYHLNDKMQQQYVHFILFDKCGSSLTLFFIYTENVHVRLPS